MAITIQPAESKSITEEIIERTWRLEMFTDYVGDDISKYRVVIHRERVYLEDDEVRKVVREPQAPEVSIALTTGEPADAPESYVSIINSLGFIPQVSITVGDILEITDELSADPTLVAHLPQLIENSAEIIVAKAKEKQAQLLINSLILQAVSEAGG